MHDVNEWRVISVQSKPLVRVPEARLGRVESGDAIDQPLAAASLELVGRVPGNVGAQTVAYQVQRAPLPGWRTVFRVIDQLTHETEMFEGIIKFR